MGRYLASLEGELRALEARAPLLIMQSNGGVMTAEGGRRRPVHVIESGPAAGVIATAALARAIGAPNALSIDMGGTTAKASIIEGYEIKRTGEFEIGGSDVAGQPAQQGRRLPAARARHRHRRGRRGRRQHRAAWTARGRSTWARGARARCPGPSATTRAAPRSR